MAVDDYGPAPGDENGRHPIKRSLRYSEIVLVPPSDGDGPLRRGDFLTVAYSTVRDEGQTVNFGFVKGTAVRVGLSPTGHFSP